MQKPEQNKTSRKKLPKDGIYISPAPYFPEDLDIFADNVDELIDSTAKAYQRQITKEALPQILQKFASLCDEYDLDASILGSNLNAVLNMAVNEIPSFKIVENKKKGAPEKWNFVRNFLCYYEIINKQQELKELGQPESIRDACRKVSKSPYWQTNKVSCSGLQDRFSIISKKSDIIALYNKLSELNLQKTRDIIIGAFLELEKKLSSD